jgi:23S rRNA pseudouridine2605 synthase
MFTTDGELANRLMHPSYQMDREYAVRVRGEVDEEMIERLKAGVMLEDGPAKFTDIKVAPGGVGFNHWYHCVVMEGRNREVRRLWESQGLVVSRLKRVRFGPVFITSDLTMGRWREMSQREVDILSEEVGLKSVALPDMKEKTRDKLERLQRKSAKPVGRGERPQRTLRPAHGGAVSSERSGGRTPRSEAGERAVRTPRSDSAERGGSTPRSEGGERVVRTPRSEGGAAVRTPRPPRADKGRAEQGRSAPGKGTPVAERPRDVNKRAPNKPKTLRPGVELSERPGRKPAAPVKRRSQPAGQGQRPGFGRGANKPQE